MKFYPIVVSVILAGFTSTEGKCFVKPNKEVFPENELVLPNNETVIPVNEFVLPSNETTYPSFEPVLSFFKELNDVPRPSQQEDKMVVYLENFAKTRGLDYIIDGKNVLIYKNATAGMENVPMVTLQGHTDMVCVAKDGYEIDFLNQGVETVNDGVYIRSKDKNTSIGADDGIGLSIILAVLDNNDIKHGPLECLFTWDEEQEFSGTLALTPGILKGKYFMNIDWETDAELCIGTAGGVDVAGTLTYDMTETPKDYVAYNLSISGLTGGHSGMNIVNGGANANKLMAEFLAPISEDYRLSSIKGGTFPNVITISSSVTILVPEAKKDEFEGKWNDYVKDIKLQYATTDADMVCTITPTETPAKSITSAHTRAIFAALSNAPQGVTEWSTTIENMFETSNNVGAVNLEDGKFNVEYLVRGFNNDNIDELANFIIAGFEEQKVGFETRKYGAFSPWNPDVNSYLMNYAQDIYKQYFGKPISLRKVGGGLEVSELAIAYPDVQFISYGPTVNDPHTINESVEIKTVDNCWRYTLALLENIGN